MFARHRIACAAIAGFALAILLGTAAAQPYGRGPGMMGPGMMGPGMMMGPGIGPGAFGRMCGPGGVGFVEWRTDRLAEVLKLTDAQRPRFDEFKAASAKAAETMRTACPAQFPATTAARMELMEQRAEAMLAAIKTVRPAFDAFYAALTDEQKKQLDAGREERRFWRHRDRW
jgi:Spy/CpxP family protein refolding chaperone